MASRRRDDGGHESIVGDVSSQIVANPAGEQRCSCSLVARAVTEPPIAENIGPLQREVAGIFGTFEQAIDQLRTFVGTGIANIVSHFGRRRDRATDI